MVHLKKQNNTKTFQGLFEHRIWTNIDSHSFSSVLCMFLGPKNPAKLAKAFDVVLHFEFYSFSYPVFFPSESRGYRSQAPSQYFMHIYIHLRIYFALKFCASSLNTWVCANMEQANRLCEKWGLNKIKYDFYFKTFQFIKLNSRKKKCWTSRTLKLTNFIGSEWQPKAGVENKNLKLYMTTL